MDDVMDKKVPKTPEPEKKPNKFMQKINVLNAKREANSEKFSLINLLLLVLFPIYITFLAEVIQCKKVSKTVEFFVDRPTVFLFDILVGYIVFAFFIAVFRRSWLVTLAHSTLYLTLSTIELFKYNTNGNHLLLSDMRLAKNVKSLSSFAYIKITWQLILCYVIAIAIFLLIFYLNPKIKVKPLARVVSGLACVVIGFAMVTYSRFYKPVYKLFKIDTTRATNAFLLNEKFDNNQFFAFLVETASESYANRLVKPSDYNEDNINKILSIKPDTTGDFNGGKKPNVIFIMSESYADFRVFDQLNVDDSYYKYFDKACKEGYSGRIITPTYASWTVRAEFELMFGLPVKGINDPNMPQRELADHALPAMARYYNSWGYNTAYVHPFNAEFYSRHKVYKRFGFKEMLYHDDQDNVTDFTVEVEHYGTYVDDKTIYNQLLDLIKTSDDPIYIHTTTMQNHQPYDQGEDPTDEFGNYLQWIQHTNEGLNDFLEALKKVDEPTLVFFVGDHFPSLRGETSVYNELDLNGENCNILYEQSYFFWSNYDADFSVVPKNKYSFFYVPYVVFKIIDAPHDAFIEKMMKLLDEVPIYSTSYDAEIPDNNDLDMLTYDRVVGDIYSSSPLDDDE
ncbi:MAG: LTA synthase family protein [Ruminococcus flavefaciens]|nr:LTA synthase family protein [Ruminococcus flavefaciens]